MGDQQPARAGMFYCFNGMGAAIGGILFYGVGYANNFIVWKIIYLICGGMTVLWSLLLFFKLPDNIMSAKNFSVEEKALLIARAAKNRTGVYNRTIKPRQILEALTDAQIWLLFVYVLLNEVINGGMSNFGKLIIKDVAGGDALRTTLYGIPQGFAQVFWVFSGPFLASRLPNARTYMMALYICPTIIGTTLIWQLPRTNLAGCLAGYYLVCIQPTYSANKWTGLAKKTQVGSYVGGLVIALQFPASNVAGYTKRTTGTAFVFLAYCIGNIIGESLPRNPKFVAFPRFDVKKTLGPQAFLAKEAPIYETGVRTVLACSVAQFFLAFAIRALLARRNAQRDREEAEGLQDRTASEMGIIEDATDFHNRKFRYRL